VEALDLVENNIQQLTNRQELHSFNRSAETSLNISRLSVGTSGSAQVGTGTGDIAASGTGNVPGLNSTGGATPKNRTPVRAQEWYFMLTMIK